MLTDELRAAGWREYPGDEVRQEGERKGLRWQWLMPGVERPQFGTGLTAGAMTRCLWRPVDPATWDHSPWMWAEVTGESLEPTEPGWWWMHECSRPVEVLRDVQTGILLWRIAGSSHGHRLTGDEDWAGPCTGMPKGSR